VTRLFVHGAGRSGRDAWLEIVDDSGIFCAYDVTAPLAEQVDALAEQAAAATISTVVAHSWGGVPTVTALAQGRITAERLVLIEPALYDLARGHPAVEAHIELITRARDRSAAGDIRGYWGIVKPVIFGAEATDESWPADEAHARRFAALPTPWGHGLEGLASGLPPTLVITGDWLAEYEAIASSLVARGATHRVLAGARHRPHDLDGFAALVDEFETATS